MYSALYVKTNYSILSSLITIDDYINYAKKHNITSLAITDNNMYGVMEFYKKCTSNNIKPVIGLEVELENSKILLYAKNYDGYKTLIKLSSINSYRKVEISDIEKYNNQVICIIPYVYKDIYNLLDKIIEEIYIGYSNKKEEKEILSITKNVVFLRQSLYIKENDKEYLKYLYMIRDGKTLLDDISYEINNYELEINNIYEYTSNENLFTASKIIDKCNLEFPKFENLLPEYQVKELSYCWT